MTGTVHPPQHPPGTARVVGFRRHEVTEYPYEAIREAVCNAVCHRDIASQGPACALWSLPIALRSTAPAGYRQA